MTLQHFNTLTPHKQHEKLLSKGVYITDRTTEDYQALLFELNGFYVEVGFARQEDDVVHVKGFNSADELRPYLKNSRLKELQKQ